MDALVSVSSEFVTTLSADAFTSLSVEVYVFMHVSSLSASSSKCSLQEPRLGRGVSPQHAAQDICACVSLLVIAQLACVVVHRVGFRASAA